MTHEEFQRRVHEAFEQGLIEGAQRQEEANARGYSRLTAAHTDEVRALKHDLVILKSLVEQLLGYIREHGEPIGDDAVTAYAACKVALMDALGHV